MVFFLLIAELRPSVADIRAEAAFALAKLADYAYRECGILPCEEIFLSFRKSGTIFANLTPSGKLCMSGFAYRHRRYPAFCVVIRSPRIKAYGFSHINRTLADTLGI